MRVVGTLPTSGGKRSREKEKWRVSPILDPSSPSQRDPLTHARDTGQPSVGCPRVAILHHEGPADDDGRNISRPIDAIVSTSNGGGSSTPQLLFSKIFPSKTKKILASANAGCTRLARKRQVDKLRALESPSVLIDKAAPQVAPARFSDPVPHRAGLSPVYVLSGTHGLSTVRKSALESLVLFQA